MVSTKTKSPTQDSSSRRRRRSSVAFYPDEEKTFVQASSEEQAEKLRAAFFRASSSDDVEKLEYLLEVYKEWIHVDMPDDDNATPLIYASCLGAEQSVKWLLSKGAAINCQDKCKSHSSTLHIA
jgi:hypothetical protein